MTGRINPVGNGPGSGHHDNPDAGRSTGNECHECIIDHPDALPLAEAAKDFVDHVVRAGLSHAGDAEAEGSHRFGSFQGLDDIKEDLFDCELTLHDQVGATGYRL